MQRLPDLARVRGGDVLPLEPGEQAGSLEVVPAQAANAPRPYTAFR